jgi:hypothetical protein
MWEIYLQLVLVQRDKLQVIHISNYWVMSGLYINEISVLQLISLYWSVIGVCISVFAIVDFVGGMWENIFSLSSVLILAVVNEVIVCRQRLYWRRLMFISLNGAKFRILHNRQFLDRKCSIQELLVGWRLYFWEC